MTIAPPGAPPVTSGPTWRRDDSGRFVLPAHTLGWQILGWTKENLLQPDGPDTGEPWQFTDEQARFMLWWYAVDARGRFSYRRGVFRRMKGHGKDPLGAVICAVEFVGPCRFDSWGKDGEPIAVSHSAAWVQTAAVSLEQTKNTMRLFPGLFTPAAIALHGIDIGKEKIYAYGGRRMIEAVTSSPETLEGARSTFVLMNETHHWTKSNDGQEMAKVIARNLAKSRDGAARALAITNAHNPGEESVAETAYDAWRDIEAGKSRARGVLYDSLEAPPDTVLADRASLKAGLLAARGDSSWLDVDRLIEEIYDPETAPSTSRRFYLNQIVAAEDAWITPQEWEAIAKPGHAVPVRSLITLGFDGSKSDDHTALVGCEVATGHLFTLGVWDPVRNDDGQIDRARVDAAVARAFATYDVVGFYSDLHPWESYVDTWEEKYGEQLCTSATARHAIAWDMRTRQRDATKAAEALHDAIVEGDISHEGRQLATSYVLNARRRMNNFGTMFGKEHRMSARKIDWLAAALLARQARQDYVALPENKKRQGNGFHGIFV